MLACIAQWPILVEFTLYGVTINNRVIACHIPLHIDGDLCIKIFLPKYVVKNVLKCSFTPVNSAFPCVFALSLNKNFFNAKISDEVG